jgi:3-hydroxyisobutyrate dehydrogenase-like beta-hydroxyacid dehydrogenase
MVAGSKGAVDTATPMIKALTRGEGGMSIVGNKVGAASDFKLINQVYCAIQICVTGWVGLVGA